MNKIKENMFIHADPGKCVACHGCELACAIAHSEVDDLLSAVAQGLKLESRNEVVAVANVVMPMQCRQCEDAPCAVACPTGAMYQHEAGFVRVVESNCIGCKVCSMVCPFGAITMSKDDGVLSNNRTKKTVARKCDLCYDQMDENNQFSCACIEACPNEAIMLVDYETYRKRLVAKRSEELAMAHSPIKI